MANYKLHAVRVFADDVPAAVRFYETVFGLAEVFRLDLPGGFTEVAMNSGNNQAEAAANPAPQFVVMKPFPGAPAEDNRAHVVIDTPSVADSVASFTAAGGIVTFGPEVFNGVTVAFVRDPFGNVLEFLTSPH